MKGLTEKLKVLTERQLSEKQMRNALPIGKEIEQGKISWLNKKEDEIRILEDGSYSRDKTSFKWMRTPDASVGWERTHVGYYPSLSIRSTYDSDGKIMEQRIFKQYVWGDIAGESEYLEKVFEPHGSWLGKKKL